MNTNPDEAKLALWLDDELHGEELAAFDAWVKDQPGHLAAREDVRRFRRMMASAIPVSEEPPYADFFNSRIARTIREQQPPEPIAAPQPRFSWKSLLMPLAACAGMVLAFTAGTRIRSHPPEIDVAGAPRAIPVEPILYTPERGVQAEWFASSGADATVIVLKGVDAIPDETDFSKTVYLQGERDIDSTAEAESQPNDDLGL